MSEASVNGTPPDFIEVVQGALGAELCAAIIARMRDSDELQPGRVGGGVFPELKDSRDLSITGHAGWEDIDRRINNAVFAGLLRYLRRYPQALIAPLMLQYTAPDGTQQRLAAENIAGTDDAALATLASACKRCIATCCGRSTSTTISRRAKPSSSSSNAASCRARATC